MSARINPGWLLGLAVITAPGIGATLSGDLNGDGAVDTADVDRMRAVFMTDDAGADLNGDGVVNYSDLAILRALVPGGPSGLVRGGNPVISITPSTGSYAIGEQIETLVSADFTVDPTVGGSFDILYDDTLFDVVSVEVLPIGDPGFSVPPTLTPGVLVGRGFGDFNGVVGGDVMRVTYEVIAAVDPVGGINPTPLTMRDGTGGGGGFFSAVTFAQQTIDYQGAEYTLPEQSRYDYVGVLTSCTADCDGYEALGGPGAANAAPSYLLGFLQIEAAPGEAFTDADIAAFRFELGNDARPGQVSDDPTLANPYVIDGGTANLTGAGTISLDGVVDSGQLALTFLSPPLSTSQARLDIDITARQLAVSFDAGATAVASGEGGFAGQAIDARVLVTPTALDFGSLPIGQDAVETNLIRNVGLADLAIGELGASDPLSPPFEFDVAAGCSNQTLTPGATCTNSARFAPLAEGVFNDSFDVPSNDPVSPVVTVAVSGEGTGVPNIVLTPAVVDFGAVPVAITQTAELTIGNDGTADLTVIQIDGTAPIDEPFSIAADGCTGQVLGIGENCTVTLAFAPQTGGIYSDILSITSDDPDQPNAVVRLDGQTPVQPAILTISGANGGLGVCINADTDDEARRLLFGRDTINCATAGLVYGPGENVVLVIFAQVDDSAGAITGNVSGVAANGAVCYNTETSQRVVIPLSDGAVEWDCTAAGLAASEGDRVLIYGAGSSN